MNTLFDEIVSLFLHMFHFKPAFEMKTVSNICEFIFINNFIETSDNNLHILQHGLFGFYINISLFLFC